MEMQAKAKNDLRLATGLWAEWVPFPLQISNKLIPSRIASFGSLDLTVRNLFFEQTKEKEQSPPRGFDVSWSASWRITRSIPATSHIRTWQFHHHYDTCRRETGTVY